MTLAAATQDCYFYKPNLLVVSFELNLTFTLLIVTYSAKITVEVLRCNMTHNLKLPTYSSHCAEAFSSVARVKNTLTKEPKFPVRQLLMAKFLQMLVVDSSSNR